MTTDRPPPPPDDDDDELLFDDDAEHAAIGPRSTASSAWRVLVADDDEGVRTVSNLVLTGHVVDGRPIELTCVGSAAEAREHLARTEDVAVAVLDVVMETENAGIDLARWIRAELSESHVRIVLRTGQPGTAPEAQVTSECNIHDYLSKSETTARRLVTCVTGAIRAWHDIRTIDAQRTGLRRALGAVAALFESATPESLPSLLVAQLSSLLAPRLASVLLASPPDLLGAGRAEPVVVAGTGAWAGLHGARFALALQDPAVAARAAALGPGQTIVAGDRVVYAFELDTPTLPVLAVHVDGLNAFERELIHLYCHTAALALRSYRMQERERSWYRVRERFVPGGLIRLVGAPDLRAVVPGENATHSMAVCFVDVRGFTARTAMAGANAAFRSMNLLFAALGDVVTAHGGIIDKFLGDGLLVLFPAPEAGSRATVDANGSAERAVRAALDMQRRARSLPQPPGEDRLEIGIGVHLGEVVVGAVGHADRMDISVVSPVVNAAARLQSAAAHFRCDILLSTEVFGGLPEALRHDCRPVLPHALCHADGEQVLYEAFGALEPERITPCRSTTALLQALGPIAARGEWSVVADRLAGAASFHDPTIPLLHAYARRRATEPA